MTVLLLIASTRAGRIGIIPVWLKLLSHHRRWGSACLFIHPERRSKRRNEGRHALSASRSCIYIFVREDRERQNESEREKRREKRCLFKNRDFLPPVTHRKSFAAAAAAAAEAEAARHRTKKGEVGTRSFEARLLLLFCRRFLLSKEREKGREREKARALIIARIGL